MKLLPLTANVYHDLVKQGYTHLVPKNTHEDEELGYASVVTMEAIHVKEQLHDDKHTVPLDSVNVDEYLSDGKTNYYVLLTNC
jgi:hypothetical protein